MSLKEMTPLTVVNKLPIPKINMDRLNMSSFKSKDRFIMSSSLQSKNLKINKDRPIMRKRLQINMDKLNNMNSNLQVYMNKLNLTLVRSTIPLLQINHRTDKDGHLLQSFLQKKYLLLINHHHHNMEIKTKFSKGYNKRKKNNFLLKNKRKGNSRSGGRPKYKENPKYRNNLLSGSKPSKKYRDNPWS